MSDIEKKGKMEMKYTILKLIVILANGSIATTGCQGDFIGNNRSCRPTECQTPAFFKPPRFCLERNEEEWKRCLTRLNRQFSSVKGARNTVHRPPHISTLSTGLVNDGATTAPELSVVISFNITSQYAYLIVNMTSSENKNLTGDPYYYRLPDQRIVHLKPEYHNLEINITLSYRGFEPCNDRCTLHGCYLYVFHLIPLSPGHLALAYYITVFNITKNGNLSKLSSSWKSAIAVSSVEGTVLVVFQPIPSRLLSPENVSYRIDIYKYPESYETLQPVQRYETQRAASKYTHTFLGIDKGEFYVQVHCVLYNQNLTWNPWSRSQPFSVTPIHRNLSHEELYLSGENTDTKNKKIYKSSKNFKIITSLLIVAALCVVILLTAGIYTLQRKPSVKRFEHPKRNSCLLRNNLNELEENVQARKFIEKFEDRLLKFNE